MNREFNVAIERDAEGYYVASVPELRGCHTQATSLDELVERVREAIELCLEVEGGEQIFTSLGSRSTLTAASWMCFCSTPESWDRQAAR